MILNHSVALNHKNAQHFNSGQKTQKSHEALKKLSLIQTTNMMSRCSHCYELRHQTTQNCRESDTRAITSQFTDN